MSTFRTFSFLKNKVLMDLDLQDETFIQSDEFVGYVNEGLKEAFGEIIGLKRENYFTTKWYLPCIQGQDLMPMPPNIYANKVKRVIYQNGSIIYSMKRMLPRNPYEDIAFVDQYGLSDEYRYQIRNDIPGIPTIQLAPPSRETAVFPPIAGPFLPMLIYYIREHNRVPLTGEFYYTEPIQQAAVNTSTNTITVVAGQNSQLLLSGGPTVPGMAYWPYVNSPISYVTGDQVQVSLNPFVAGSGIPSGLVLGTTYYVIRVSPTQIQLASTLANALAGTATGLGSTGNLMFNLSVAGTPAIQLATLLDIPECYEFIMQWTKVRCCEKEGDPRYEAMVAELQSQRKMMVDTLTEMVEDDDTEVQGDYSHYLELS